jgi:hypothetical protein
MLRDLPDVRGRTNCNCFSSDTRKVLKMRFINLKTNLSNKKLKIRRKNRTMQKKN